MYDILNNTSLFLTFDGPKSESPPRPDDISGEMAPLPAPEAPFEDIFWAPNHQVPEARTSQPIPLPLLGQSLAPLIPPCPTSQTLHLYIHPQNLGPLDIEMTWSSSQTLHLAFTADSSQTLALLHHHTAALTQYLGHTGYPVSQMVFYKKYPSRHVVPMLNTQAPLSSSSIL